MDYNNCDVEVVMFERENQEIYLPRGGDNTLESLARTTHLAIAAHQDDIEIMAFDGILKAFETEDSYFSGCIVTDGHGSPRAGKFRQVNDDQMAAIRMEEQREAARAGNYSALVFLGYESHSVKKSGNKQLLEDLQNLVKLTRPEIIYTHNLADKHHTHVGVTLRLVEALRGLPAEFLPQKLIGCEVWRGLDWLPDDQKVIFDLSERKDLQRKLVEVFASQTQGKNYVDAILGRRAANATFFASHVTDRSSGLGFGMDLTPLLEDPGLDPAVFLKRVLKSFEDEVMNLLEASL